METWKEYRIKDLGEVITGNTPPTSNREYYGSEYKFIKPTDMVEGQRFVPVTEEYYSELAYQKYKRCLLPPKTPCVVTIGSLGKKMCLTDTECFTNQAVNAVIPNKNNDGEFLYYAFKASVLAYVKQLDSGTTSGRENVSKSSFSNIKVKVPPLPTQQKIASILSAYDNLIQNYKKQIEDLQTTASELYKEWFVRFRFPGYEKIEMKDSCIGKIPITFEVKKQNEVIRDYIGGGWGEDEESEKFPIEAAVVRGADFPEFTNGDISTCPVRYHKISNYNSRIINADDIVLEVSGGTQEQPVGRTVIVSQERLNRFDNKLICASFCKLIRLDKTVISPFFYYYWMQFVYYTRIIDRYQLQSTGIINFKFEYFLRKGDVLIPPTELMESFDSKVKVIHSKIEKLAISIENLTQQRDLLLPRLMSGKLEVE